MPNPEVTVCVPAYQSGKFLRQTLESLAAQTFTDWACHVVDDCSTDDTFDIAKEFAVRDRRFLVSKNERRLGAAANWNRSIEGVKSEYVKLLCSDDVLAPTALTSVVSALRAHPEATYAATRRDVIDESGRTLWQSRGLWPNAAVSPGPAALRRFVKTGTNLFGEPSFGLYRASALLAAGGFDARWSYLIDVASYRDVLRNGTFVPVNETLGAFRVRGESWSASLIGKQASETQAMVREIGQLPWVNAASGEILIGQARAGINALARRPFFWLAEVTAKQRPRT